jgi:hypothetical protein
MNTPNVTVYFAKGVAQYQDKKLDDAIATYNVLLQKDPTYALGYFI